MYPEGCMLLGLKRASLGVFFGCFIYFQKGISSSVLLVFVVDIIIIYLIESRTAGGGSSLLAFVILVAFRLTSPLALSIHLNNDG